MDEPQFIHQVPRMDEVKVMPDIPFAVRGDADLKLDVYRPPEIAPTDRLPAVIFIHGDGPPEFLENIKDQPPFQMWGRLAGASGFVGVTFNHRSSQLATRVGDPVEDVDDAIAFVRSRADDFNIDPDQLALWSFSAGGYLGLQAALKGRPSYVLCAVCYYGIIDLELYLQRSGIDLPPGVEAFNPIRSLREHGGTPIPLQIIRAGQDRPAFNASIDSFINAALEHNVDLELLNYAAGEHAFDIFDDSLASKAIVQRSLAFLTQHLT